MEGATISPKEMRGYQERINRATTMARRVEDTEPEEELESMAPGMAMTPPPAASAPLPNAQTQVLAAQQLRQRQQAATITMMMAQQQQQQAQAAQPSKPKIDPETKRMGKMLNIFQLLEKAGTQTYALGGDMSFNETVLSLARLMVTHFKGVANFSLFKKIPPFDKSDPSDNLHYYLTIFGLATILAATVTLCFMTLITVAVAFTFYDKAASIQLFGFSMGDFIFSIIF